MLIIVKGKDMEVTPEMRALAWRKVAKLERYMPGASLVEVEFSVEAARSVVDRQIVRANLETPGGLLHAEERAAALPVALDSVIDQLQNQIKDNRSRERALIRGRFASQRGLPPRLRPRRSRPRSPFS